MTMEIIISIVAIVISIVAIVLSFIAASEGNKISQAANKLMQSANEFTSTQTNIQMGALEIQVREMITNARSSYEDASLKVLNYSAENTSDDTSSDENVFEHLRRLESSAHENFCNAYDTACQIYSDKKIDIDRFEKAYYVEIRNWVEADNSGKYDAVKTRFRATVNVYNEWNNLEARKKG